MFVLCVYGRKGWSGGGFEPQTLEQLAFSYRASYGGPLEVRLCLLSLQCLFLLLIPEYTFNLHLFHPSLSRSHCRTHYYVYHVFIFTSLLRPLNMLVASSHQPKIEIDHRQEKVVSNNGLCQLHLRGIESRGTSHFVPTMKYKIIAHIPIMMQSSMPQKQENYLHL